MAKPHSRKTKPPALPKEDNKKGSIKKLLKFNAYYRKHAWPAPFDETAHRLIVQDACDMRAIKDSSVHLVVTSPPYWNLKQYNTREKQLGDIEDYEKFLSKLDSVWGECARVLIPGGRICCVVGDVCVSRRVAGRHYVAPLHADIQVRSRKVGLDTLTPIFWGKIANASLEAEGNGGGFLGKPYQPGAIIKNDTEFILFMRKPGDYRSPTMLQKGLSMMTQAEMKSWLVSAWSDIKGASTRNGHPAPYPPELAERLIKMFSYAGDTVLDPFVGSGSTTIAAIRAGRNSIGADIDKDYLQLAISRCKKELEEPREVRRTRATLLV